MTRLPYRICDGVALSDTSLPVEAGDVAWHQIALQGSWKGHWQGPFSITADTLKQMSEFGSAKQIPTVVDYNHASISSDEAPAAGWLTDLDLRQGEDGQSSLFGRIEWTQRAAEKIRAKEYRFLSPTIRWNTVDRRSGKMGGASLHSVALTNTPFLHELPEVRLNSLTAALRGMRHGGNTMDQIARLAEVLGLSETAPEAVMAAGEKMISLAAKAISALSLNPDATPEALEAAINALRTQATAATAAAQTISALEARLASIETRDRDAAALSAVRVYQSQRKIAADGTPNFAAALAHAKSDLQGFNALMESMNAWVPAAEPVAPAPTTEQPAQGLSELQREINRQLGISDETFQKYAKA